MTGVALAALFGALAYATYDLTNYATLRNWNLQITVLDIIWGASRPALPQPSPITRRAIVRSTAQARALHNQRAGARR